jgi:hypothetical protein
VLKLLPFQKKLFHCSWSTESLWTNLQNDICAIALDRQSEVQNLGDRGTSQLLPHESLK